MCPHDIDEILDIPSLVYNATAQIPKGMVSTYGDIADALGDRIAARAVGEILSHNPMPIAVPCHRVVYSSGMVGWYIGFGNNSERKVELLRSEGIEIKNGKIVDLPRVRFTRFDIPPILKWLKVQQDSIGGQVIDHDIKEFQFVAGMDVSYSGERAFAASSTFDLMSGKEVGTKVVESRVRFPYIPTYLSYREIPAIGPLIDHKDNIVYLIDGQGRLHPRRAGIACQVGVEYDVATIGAAKSLLVGHVQDPLQSSSPIFIDEEKMGVALREGKKTTFVSIGHKVSLAQGEAVCRKLLVKGIPAPLRRAHELANKARREAGP